jgi:predicted transcriptional regulator
MVTPKKAQLSVYLDPDVMQALSAYAARREQSMSLIAEAAIASFLSPDADERREAAIAKRLDQQESAWRGSNVMSGSVSRRWRCSSASGSTRRRPCRSQPQKRRALRPGRRTTISS